MSTDLINRFTFLFGNNAVYVEELYKQYLQDKNNVSLDWQNFFAAEMEFGKNGVRTTASIINLNPASFNIPSSSKSINKQPVSNISLLESKLRLMLERYRSKGHFLSRLDPLNIEVNKEATEFLLDRQSLGLSDNDLIQKVNLSQLKMDNLSSIFNNKDNLLVQDFAASLNKIYADSAGVEFAYVENKDEQDWLYSNWEQIQLTEFTKNKKHEMLLSLVETEGFEQYLHIKFPGAKRFSIEGGESAICIMEKIIELLATKSGTQDVVLGMAHRGRLSTLAKIMGKPYEALFSEFMGKEPFPAEINVSGDVKYHMGYSSDKIYEEDNKIHLSLTPNPSHLEAINPVVAGKVRAKQKDYLSVNNLDDYRDNVAAILVHGDAAFCGQGVVTESLSMSSLKPYDVGGIFHLVINNQIGFTANSQDGRNGRYCTEAAKMIGAPIIHVNGDDIEACVRAAIFAFEYKYKFKKDIVIDVVCYRKYGHNEGDEPMYTQGYMYNIIKQKKTVAAIYNEILLNENIIEDDIYNQMKMDFKQKLDDAFAKVEDFKPVAQWLTGKWAKMKSNLQNDQERNPITGVSKKILLNNLHKLCDIPKDFDINKKLVKLFNNRLKNAIDNNIIDWATAESLAFASLLLDNHDVRITGQDSGRGTFSHRHSVLHSQISATEKYIPLNNLSKNQGNYEVADSNLSEYAVLGFEFGYSLVSPDNLVIWEAQFGDFANGAQIIFDQFISSSEQKWLRKTGLVVLLPHGFEGQGPEHSSARLERFLSLCGDNNMQITYPTTPASIFHLLRRQLKRNYRKPLIIMSPKSIFRNQYAVSSLDDISGDSRFLPIIDDIDINNDVKNKNGKDKIKTIILCAGKVYYDLYDSKIKNNKSDVALIRVEELYPFDEKLMINYLNAYKSATKVKWVQEEPENMGALDYIRPILTDIIDNKIKNNKLKLEFISRNRSASPACGYLYVHNKQQEAILKKAFE